MEFKKKSKVGSVIFQRTQKLECQEIGEKNLDAMNQSMAFDENNANQEPQLQNKFKDIRVIGVSTDVKNNYPSCKVMGDIPIQYNKYQRNNYYFQVRIDDNYDDQPWQTQ